MVGRTETATYRWSKEMSERSRDGRWWRVLGRLVHWALASIRHSHVLVMQCPLKKKKKANTHFLFLVTTES